MQRFTNTMNLRVTPEQPQSTSIPIGPFPYIPNQDEVHEEEIEKKALQTIYAQLKQAACCPDEKRAEKRWEKIEKLFKSLQYKRDKKKIIEKLDDDNNFAPIHYAVRSNNRFVCQKLLSNEYKCNVNLLGWAGQTPLHLAACSSRLEKKIAANINAEDSILFILLTNRKIQINIQDDKGRTPLHHAIMRNHIAIIKILLNYRADYDIPDVIGATPVHYAYRFGQKQELFSLFPLHQGLFQLETVDHKTPFEIAAEYGHLDIIKQYFEKLSDNARSDHSIRALIHGAVRQHHPEILSHYISTTGVDNYILQIACRQPKGHELFTNPHLSKFFTKRLMSKCISEDGFTPLMIAVKYQQEECVNVLLTDKYCDKTILEIFSYDFERTVLHICAEFPNEIITNVLLKRAEDVRLDLAPVDVMGNTPLHICAQNNNIYMCKKLLSSRQTGIPHMLTIRNNDGLTALHEAIQKGYFEIVEKMTATVTDRKTLIEECDEELNTGLHMAALKGDVRIVDLFLDLKANVHAYNINDHTPLHEAARWSDSIDEENQNRIECIDHLIGKGADVNALNIHRESPLHIACRYGASSLVKCLLKHGVDLLQTNTYGFNCLEVAIEEENEEVVKYLIEHDYIFELMRNAQIDENPLKPCCTCGNKTCHDQCCIPCCKCLDKCALYIWPLGLDDRKADTPMRKLIISMPDMAFEILEKCTTTIGSKRSQTHKQFFDYEFLEDQYAIYDWRKGNLINNPKVRGKPSDKSEVIKKDRPYTSRPETLVMNHPLFLMAVHNRYKLMAHPLSRSLVNQKMFWLSFVLFIIAFALYAVFLGIYTTIVLRTKHPQYYYNLTGFDFDSNLCRNVTQALIDKGIALKQKTDYVLQGFMTGIIILTILKNILIIIVYIRVSWTKLFTFFLELISLVFGFYFIFGLDYQSEVTMRCPIQWEMGAFGLLVGFIGLFYYIQYIPIFGIYIIMMRQIVIRFLLFLPVLVILMFAFGISLYMIFQNFDYFGNIGISIPEIIIMSTGEINYNDLMFDDKTRAYYMVGYILVILLAITMVVFVTNLLISLAVGEIAPMIATAKNTRLDMFYELAADFEILKFQFLSIFNRIGCCLLAPKHYKQNDLKKQWQWWQELKKRVLKSCAREADNDDLDDQSEDEDTDNPIRILEEVKKGIQQLHKPRPNTAVNRAGPSKTAKGTGNNKSTRKK